MSSESVSAGWRKPDTPKKRIQCSLGYRELLSIAWPRTWYLLTSGWSLVIGVALACASCNTEGAIGHKKPKKKYKLQRSIAELFTLKLLSTIVLTWPTSVLTRPRNLKCQLGFIGDDVSYTVRFGNRALCGLTSGASVYRTYWYGPLRQLVTCKTKASNYNIGENKICDLHRWLIVIHGMRVTYLIRQGNRAVLHRSVCMAGGLVVRREEMMARVRAPQ